MLYTDTHLNQIQSPEHERKNSPNQIKSKHHNPTKSQPPTQIATTSEKRIQHNTTQPSPAQPSPGRVEDDAATSQAAISMPGKRKGSTQTSTHHSSPQSPNDLLTPCAQPPKPAASHRHACQSSPCSRVKRQHARLRARLWCPVLGKKC
jgi:hypothetical protein